MPWFKVDDGLPTHPKWLGLSKGARALWVTAGAWAARELTNGRIPSYALRVLDGTPKEAAQLVEVGMWHVDADGWVFHDWLIYQPTAEDTRKERERWAEKKAAYREKKRAEREAARAAREESDDGYPA